MVVGFVYILLLTIFINCQKLFTSEHFALAKLHFFYNDNRGGFFICLWIFFSKSDSFIVTTPRFLSGQTIVMVCLGAKGYLSNVYCMNCFRHDGTVTFIVGKGKPVKTLHSIYLSYRQSSCTSNCVTIAHFRNIQLQNEKQLVLKFL